MSNYRVFIPTRDSGAHVGIFLDHFREKGLEPFYVVDERSCDDTVAMLEAKNAEILKTNPSGSFGVTEMVEAACAALKTDWIVRLDDDEFPSQAMIDFITHMSNQPRSEASPCYSFNREWLRACRDTVTFYRVRRATWGNEHDTQHRMFQNTNIEFDHQIHTVGIKTVHPPAVAPDTCFIVHFDMLLKSPEQQLAKVRRYEAIDEGSGWAHADLYLPDLYSDRNFIFRNLGMAEFMPLIGKLPKPTRTPVTLTDAERNQAKMFCRARLKQDQNPLQFMKKLWMGFTGAVS